ncbi:MAG: hypothetical protein ACXW3Z_16520, partial [Limisphaerales bacterium]
MFIVLLIITWLVLAFMVGVIRTLQGRVDSLESEVEMLSFKTRRSENKLPQAQEPVFAHESEPEPFYQDTDQPIRREPILISRAPEDLGVPAKPFPSHIFTSALPPVLEPPTQQPSEASTPPPLESTAP